MSIYIIALIWYKKCNGPKVRWMIDVEAVSGIALTIPIQFRILKIHRTNY